MADERHSAAQMIKIFKAEPSFMDRLKNDTDKMPVLEEVARKAERETAAWVSDTAVFRAAVGVLGALVAACPRRSRFEQSHSSRAAAGCTH